MLQSDFAKVVARAKAKVDCYDSFMRVRIGANRCAGVGMKLAAKGDAGGARVWRHLYNVKIRVGKKLIEKIYAED